MTGRNNVMSTEPVGRINDTVDVVVVGAGLAGLTAARALHGAGVKTAVVEARQRAGGRAWTKRDALLGHSFEMGGMFVDASQRAISATLREYGLTTTAVPGVHSTAWWTNGQRRTALLPVPGAELPGLERAVRAWQDAAVDPDDRRLDALSAADYFSRLDLGPHTRDLLDAFFSEQASASWTEMSMRYLALDLAEAGGSVAAWITAASLSHTVDGGISRLVQRLCAAAGLIHFSAPARAITDDGDQVAVDTERGRLSGAYAILAVPLNTWKYLDVDPAWPDDAAALITRGHAGRGYKLGLLLGGSVPDYALAAGCGMHMFKTLQRHRDGTQTAVVFGPNFADIDPADTAALRRLIAPVAPEAEVIAAVSHNWTADPWSRGTWLEHYPTTTAAQVAAVRRAHGRIVPAGSDVAAVSASYLDGAIASGHHAAGHVMRLLRRTNPAAIR